MYLKFEIISIRKFKEKWPNKENWRKSSNVSGIGYKRGLYRV